jgi:hypothetical protein
MFCLLQKLRNASAIFRSQASGTRLLGVELLGGVCSLPEAGHRRPVTCRPQLEPLEQRMVLSHTRPTAIDYNGWFHVFSTGDDGHLYDHRTQDNVNWVWDDRGSAGGGFFGNPAVTTAWAEGSNRLHVYLTAFNGHLYDCWFDGGWHLDDHGNGGSVSALSDPGVVTFWDGSVKTHVFVTGWANSSWHVYDHWWDGNNWHWDDHRAESGWNFRAPAVTTYWNGGVFQIHAFTTDVHGNLFDLYSNDHGATWHFDNHRNYDTSLTSGPGVAVYDGQLHVLVAAQDHLIDHWWDGNWHWTDLGGTGRGELSTPAVTTYWSGDVHQLHAYVTGAGDLYDVYTNDGGRNWSFDNHGHGNDYVNYDPGTAIDDFDRLHVFVHGNDGHEYDHWWDGDWHWDDRGIPNSGYGPGGGRAAPAPRTPEKLHPSPLPLERQTAELFFAAPDHQKRFAERANALTMEALDWLAGGSDFVDARPLRSEIINVKGANNSINNRGTTNWMS